MYQTQPPRPTCQHQRPTCPNPPTSRLQELSDTSGKNKRSAGLADVATLGDAWLGPAIARGLVQSIPGAETYRWHRLLPPRLQQLVRRDARGQYDPHGQVYGAPYR